MVGSVCLGLEGSWSELIFITPALPVVGLKGNGNGLKTSAVIETVSKYVCLHLGVGC